jgi:hypothetical protein
VLHKTRLGGGLVRETRNSACRLSDSESFTDSLGKPDAYSNSKACHLGAVSSSWLLEKHDEIN